MLLSYGETLTNSIGLINKVAFVVESAAVIGDDDALLLAEDIVLLPVYFKANVALSLVEKKDLSEVIELVEENCVAWLVPGFQVPQDFNHEIAVLVVPPAVVIVRVLAEFLLENEVLLVVREEVRIQELLVEVILNLIGHLIENVQVLNVPKSLILVVLPLEFKIGLDFAFQLHI